MNNNDYRLKAYASAAGNAPKKNDDLAQHVKPFIPQKITTVPKTENIMTESRKPVSSGNVSVAKNTDGFTKVSSYPYSDGVALKEAADALKSGGLLKVPVSGNETDGQDSVYRRVAKFLLLIGVDRAAEVMKHLSQEETEKIIPEIASIRNVGPDEATAIFAEFNAVLERVREGGGRETAYTILEKAFGGQMAQEMLTRAVPEKSAKPFAYLDEKSPDQIFLLLKDESTAIRALVLSHLNPKKAAAVINSMNADDKKDIVLRLAKMDSVSPEVILRIDKTMHEKALAQLDVGSSAIDGRNSLAQILKLMDMKSGQNILDDLSESDPELGQDLKAMLFTEEDFLKSNDRFIQDYLRILTDVEIAHLITGKTTEFIDKIFSNISSGRAETVLEEQEARRPMARSECERITHMFYTTLRHAWENGKLTIEGRDDDVYV